MTRASLFKCFGCGQQWWTLDAGYRHLCDEHTPEICIIPVELPDETVKMLHERGDIPRRPMPILDPFPRL